MAKPIKNDNIKDNYRLYDNLLRSEKKLLSPTISINKDRDKDLNHKGALKRKVPIITQPSEDCFLEVIINESNRKRFNFTIEHEISAPLRAARFDSDGQAHKNNIPNIPLELQQVTTPHFHKFRDDGYFFAYKTNPLIENESDLSINKMFPIFCEEFHITYPKENDVLLDISMEGELNFGETDFDPHENINFEL